MYRIYEVNGGPPAVAPEWINLERAVALISSVVGDENSDLCFRKLMCSETVSWRAREGKQDDEGELQELTGLELDARGLRALLFGSRYVQ